MHQRILLVLNLAFELQLSCIGNPSIFAKVWQQEKFIPFSGNTDYEKN